MTHQSVTSSDPTAPLALRPSDAAPDQPTTPRPEPPKQPEPGKLSLIVVDNPASLTDHLAAWDALAAAAIEPNSFYEPSLLLPAIQAFGAGKDLRFLLFYTPDPARPVGPPLLCGFFPLERRRYGKLPLRAIRIWQYPHCMLCVPLLRKPYTRDCLAAFLDCLASEEWSAPVLELPLAPGEGPFHQTLAQLLYERATPTFIQRCFTRPMLRPQADSETYLRAAISGDHRRKFRKKEQNLGKLGHLEYSLLPPDANVDLALQELLQLEISGWKGQTGAMKLDENDRQFFFAAARALASRQRMMMLSLRLDGKPVACKWNFLAPPGGFTFKIGFDERHAPFSPGALLEIENIRRFHNMPQLQWLDSCTSPRWQHYCPWIDSRTIQETLIPTGRPPGDLLVASLPLFRWIKRKLRPPKPMAGADPRTLR